MKNKELLNERILGLAGIKPMTSIGLSKNVPLNEHHGEGVIVTNEETEKFYAELKDALRRGASIESRVPGAMGDVVGIDGTGVVIKTSRGNGVVGFMGEPIVELYEDEYENYYIRPVEVAQNLNESKTRLDERVLGLPGISYPQSMAFSSNAPTLQEGGVPNDVKKELLGMFGQLNADELSRLYQLYKEDPDYVMSGEVDDALFRNSDVGGFGQDMPDDPGNYGDYEGEEEFMMGENSQGSSVDEFYKKVAQADEINEDPYEMISDAMNGKFGPEIEKEVSEKYNETSVDSRLHADDDFEDIISKMVEDIYKDWNQDNHYITQKTSDERYGPLNEETTREILGMTHKTTKFKAHSKDLLSERMMGFAGITPLKPIGFVSTNAPMIDNSEFTKNINEGNDTLSKSDLYTKLPMLHSSVLMELAEKYVESASGKSWGYIVESLTDAYYTNTNVKDSIHEVIKNAGII